MIVLIVIFGTIWLHCFNFVKVRLQLVSRNISQLLFFSASCLLTPKHVLFGIYCCDYETIGYFLFVFVDYKYYVYTN